MTKEEYVNKLARTADKFFLENKFLKSCQKYSEMKLYII